MLASTNQKLYWKAGVGGSNQKEEDESEIAKEEGAEDDSAVSTEPAGDPLQGHVVQLAGEGSSPEDPQEELDESASSLGGKSSQINKLINSFKKSRNATK